MSSILMAYGTGDGQTEKVAEYIETVLASDGHVVTTHDLSGGSTIPAIDETVDAVMVGASVRNRRHQPEVIAFVERNREALAERPSAFFQLSLASAMPFRWAREGAMDYVDALVEQTGWQPDHVALFAGAIMYTRYDFPTRLLFKLVAMVTTGDTDTSRDYEYTDWNEVERFAHEFAEFAEDRIEPPSAGRLGAAVRRTGQAAALAVLGLGVAGIAYWVFGSEEPS